MGSQSAMASNADLRRPIPRKIMLNQKMVIVPDAFECLLDEADHLKFKISEATSGW